MTGWLDSALPLVSVLLGAGITYVLGVRSRRATKQEDIYHEAIAAIAEAQAAKDFVNQAVWDGATPDELTAFTAKMNRVAIENGIACIARARIALARASAYDPSLQRWLDVPAHLFIIEAASPAIDRLRADLGQR